MTNDDLGTRELVHRYSNLMVGETLLPSYPVVRDGKELWIPKEQITRAELITINDELQLIAQAEMDKVEQGERHERN